MGMAPGAAVQLRITSVGLTVEGSGVNPEYTGNPIAAPFFAT